MGAKGVSWAQGEKEMKQTRTQKKAKMQAAAVLSHRFHDRWAAAKNLPPI
jgi:hypothetical protein